MTITEQIHIAIIELEKKNVRKQDMILTCSPLVGRLLDREFYENNFSGPRLVENGTIFGVAANFIHYENEIVVYHKAMACYRPELKCVIDCRHMISTVVAKS